MSTAASSADARPLRSDIEEGDTSRVGFSGQIRRAARIAVILLWTGVLTSCMAVAWLPSWFLGKRGVRWRARVRRPFFRFWARGALRILGVRITTDGPPPPLGSLIVSNHLSYLDIVVLASVVSTVFVSKAEVRNWPFWGPIATMGGTIYIDRSRKRDTVRTLSDMGAAFERGDSVVVFPEATSTAGDTIIPFKSSLLATAAAKGNLVHWMTVTYATPNGARSARDAVCWWGDMQFLEHFLGLCALPRVDGHVSFGDTPIRSTDRKRLALELRDSMLQRFRPVTPSDEPNDAPTP